ncbi:6-phosphogluconolactonase [Blochmannia endosymbiont of Polyrhachis (Hedomyrma) turneri]|nr:6-phosphogluconolactonase [Blochmannia endosymbiont of Polyrhachis (Hedomyrma) turneri]
MKQIIYITSPNSHNIHVWKIDENLLPRPIQTINTIEQVQPMIIHPNKKKLYVGTRITPKIIIYHIEKNGILNQQGELLISGYSTHLNINKQGSCLYSTSYNNNSLDVIQLNNSGECTSILQILTGLSGCHSSNIEITNTRLWVPCLKEDSVRIYDINNLGTLNTRSLKMINIKTNSGPRHMVFHHSYRYAYIINEISSTVNVVKINKYTNCTPIITQTVNIIPDDNMNIKITKNNWASDIHITHDNCWLYCSERQTSIISYFKILQEGKKLQYAGSQATESQPRGFAIDDSGTYLTVAGQKSNFCSVYEIDKKIGALKHFFRFPVGIGPTWIKILNQ